MIFAADGEFASWTNVAATLVSSGFAGFVAWFLLTKALPQMQQEFRQALKEQQQEFRQALKEQQQEFARSEEQRRSDGKAGLDAILEHCERETERHRAELALVQKQLEQHGEVLEDVRTRLLEWDARRRDRPRRPPQSPQ